LLCCQRTIGHDIRANSGHYGRMSAQLVWHSELLAVAAASRVLPEIAPMTVAFETPEATIVIDFASGVLVERKLAEYALQGTAETFNRLIRGQETLQVAYLRGEVRLRGPAEGLLRLAFIFEECAKALASI
jgi:hypothetical protein